MRHPLRHPPLRLDWMLLSLMHPLAARHFPKSAPHKNGLPIVHDQGPRATQLVASLTSCPALCECGRWKYHKGCAPQPAGGFTFCTRCLLVPLRPPPPYAAVAPSAPSTPSEDISFSSGSPSNTPPRQAGGRGTGGQAQTSSSGLNACALHGSGMRVRLDGAGGAVPGWWVCGEVLVMMVDWSRVPAACPPAPRLLREGPRAAAAAVPSYRMYRKSSHKWRNFVLQTCLVVALLAFLLLLFWRAIGRSRLWAGRSRHVVGGWSCAAALA